MKKLKPNKKINKRIKKRIKHSIKAFIVLFSFIALSMYLSISSDSFLTSQIDFDLPIKNVFKNNFNIDSDEIQPIENQKITGFKYPMDFMGVQIEELNNKDKNPIWTAISGVKNGEEVPEDLIRSESLLSNGEYIYRIEPVLPYEDDTKFYITINEENKKLESIRIVQNFRNEKHGIKARNKLIKQIMQNYTLISNDDGFYFLKNKYGDLITINLNKTKRSHELIFYFLDYDKIYLE